MIKLIATDMDGTLLNEHGKLNKEFFTILKKLRDKKILFVAASGRQYYNLLHNFNSDKDNIVYVAENGSFVMNNDLEIYSNFMTKENIELLVKTARKIEGANIVLCGKKSAYIESTEKVFVEEVDKYYTRCEVVEDILNIKDDILKIAICDFNNVSENSYPHFYPRFKDNFQIAVSGSIWLDLMNKGVNKGQAIKALQSNFNISKDETMVFGDYFNDLEMMDCAKFSYAMENAVEEVKAAANFIAKSNKDNGVLHTIKECIL